MRIPRATPSKTARVLVALTLGLALVSGCSTEGAETDCGLDACTVTFDVGVDAKVSILGIDARLVGTNGDVVTLEVAGEQISLTAGQAATEVGGLQVSLQSVTDTAAVVRISRA